MMVGETLAKMQKGTVDRISRLPDFIFHTIFSRLDTKEAGRASVLSKRWYGAWSSIPVLDFQYQYFQKCDDRPYMYDDDMFERFVGFIDKTMQRYLTKKYRITEMYLDIALPYEKRETLIDQWIMIAVQNQIQKLEIKIVVLNRYDYSHRLPEILFCAKSLKYLKCLKVELPYYETMELTSLEYLTLERGAVNVDMLQRIISFCPLIELDVTSIHDLEEDSLSCMGKVNGGGKSRGSGTMQAPSLQKFVGYGYFAGLLPHMVVLKNLKKLEFDCAPVTDDILSELAYGLVALETLVLIGCSTLECIKISSNSLKQLRIEESFHLMKVTIDTPNLLEFLYNCEMETSLSLISVLDHCNAQFFPSVKDSVKTVWFVKLKKFLIEMNIFNSLVMDLCHATGIEVDVDQLQNDVTGPSYKLKELKLCEKNAWRFEESLLRPFLDGLFCCCHPDVLSTRLRNAATHKLILNILKRKVQCWKHPLRSVEVEGVDCSELFSESSDIEVSFRLSWF